MVQFLSSLPNSAAPAIQKLRRLGVPSVFAYTLPGKDPSNPFKRRFRQIGFRRLCRRLDTIVTASSATRSLLDAMGIKSRIEVIPNGVDIQRFRPVRDEAERFRLRQDLGIKAEDPVLLSIGAIHPRKGIDLLLEAWGALARRYPNAHSRTASMICWPPAVRRTARIFWTISTMWKPTSRQPTSSSSHHVGKGCPMPFSKRWLRGFPASWRHLSACHRILGGRTKSTF